MKRFIAPHTASFPRRLARSIARIAACATVFACSGLAQAAPPYSGTIYLAPNLITAADPSDYVGVSYSGQGVRLMFDRRTNAYAYYNAYLFDVIYANDVHVQAQVNPEFGSPAAAQAQVEFYAPVIGRIPRALRSQVSSLWIHAGDQPFGGGNNSLLIHTGSYARDYIACGILEETFVHEATHTSLDPFYAGSSGWWVAQQWDREYISTYARDNPTREDMAETFLMWLAVRHGLGRVPPDVAYTVLTTVPYRLQYFDSLRLDLNPYAATHP
jgi:hypothetical protein